MSNDEGKDIKIKSDIDMKKPVKNTKPATSQVIALRRRAEKMAHKKAALSPNKPGAMSPEETRRTLHELQVHQIELEMQNEEMGRTHAELDASRSRYFDLYDLAPVGYCTISEQGLILEANLTAATLLGVPRGKLVKQLLTRFILEEDQDIFYLHRKNLLDTGEPQMCELRIVKKNGTVFWAHLTGAAANDESGATVCRVVMSDITERKSMEEKLRFEEQRFRSFIEHSSDIIVIMNREGVITYVNPAVERALGFKVEERIGAKGFERIHPDDLKFLTDAFNTLAGATNAPVLQSEIRLRHKDGSWRTFEAVGSNLVHNNVVETVIVNYRDITERKQVEEALRQSEKKYRIILENIQEGYFEVDLVGNFTFFNDSVCRVLGYSRKELIGMNNRQYTDKEESKKVLKAYNKVYKTGKPLKEFGYWISRKDGCRRYIEGSVTLLKNSSGKSTGFRGITNDFTERKRVEESLKETELKFRTIFDSASDGILLLNVGDGKFSAANKKMCNMLGYTNEELLTLGIHDIHPPESIPLVIDHAEKISTKEMLIATNTPVMKKDKTVFFADISGSPITLGEKEYLIGMFRDITDRKQAENAVIVNHAQMLAIFDAIDEPVYVADTETHEILYINKATNLAWGDLEDRKCFEYLQNRKRPCPFCTNSKILGEYSGRSYVWEFQNEVNKKWYRCIDKAISWPDGRLVRYEMAVDITERKRAEEEIKSAKVFLDMVIDMSPFAMWISDKEGTITRVNLSLCNVINLKEDEIVGKYNVLKDLNLEIQGVMPMVISVFEKHEPARFIIPWKAADAGGIDFKGARDMHIDVSMFPILNAQGELTNVVCQWVDITERKKSEEALEKYREHLEDLVRERTIKLEASNNELEAFSYSASHDLRAPLRTIDGFSQAILEDCEDKLNIQGKDYLIRIRAATKRMADLIEDLLQLSRIARTELNIEKINLTRIARSIIDELQKSQPQRHVEIKIADGLEDAADSRLMRITLDNLLGNAWKFTEKQAKAVIEFGCTKEGGKKVYFIRDNGAGFDMAYADKLFAPFQRLHNEEEFPGTGIGLALVRRIIHRHGGKVWTEGQAGKGATFYFSLH